MIRQVAYVMSLNFSGSTILSLALSLLRGSYFVGEPALIFRKSRGAYRHSKFCTVCKAGGVSHECPVWGDAIVESLRADPASYWTTVSKHLPADRDLIIDASKDLRWIKSRPATDIESSIIHISKSPHAWIASLRKKNQVRFPLEFYGLQWAESLQSIHSFSTNHGMKYLYVSYEEFVGDFNGTMADIARFLGREWDSSHVINLADFHYVKGNPGVNKRVATDPAIDLSKDLVLDTSWQQVLSVGDLNRIYSFRRVRDLAEQSNQYPADVLAGKPSGNALSMAYSSALHAAYRLLSA